MMQGVIVSLIYMLIAVGLWALVIWIVEQVLKRFHAPEFALWINRMVGLLVAILIVLNYLPIPPPGTGARGRFW